MRVYDNRTTRKDNNKYQTKDVIYNQYSMSIKKKNHNKIQLASDKTYTKYFIL